MAQEGCPLTIAFLDSLREFNRKKHEPKRKPDGVTFLLVDDLEDSTGDLREEAQDSTPDNTALSLRGFYAVEVLYHEILPSALSPVTAGSSLGTMAAGGARLRRIANWRFPRSYEGLTGLLDAIRALKEDSKAVSVAMSLDRRIDSGLRDHHRSLTSSWLVVSDTLEGVVIELRKFMRGGVTRWEIIGSGLALAIKQANLLDEEALLHASVLLGINRHNAVHPWDRKRNCRG